MSTVTEITICLDANYDLRVGSSLSGAELTDDQWSAVVETFTDRWTAEAIRIGAEYGYDVDVHDDTTSQYPGRTTRTVADEDGDTWERLIWQAAHDAIGHTDIMEMVKAAQA